MNLNICIQGEKRPGVPTLILESGIGQGSESWRHVQPKLSQITRVCSYDRAGYGLSDGGESPRTFDRMVRELKTLLEKKNIQPPYILVGHSLGGPIARYFHSQYPQEVVGIIAVDALHLTPPKFSPIFRILTIALYYLARLFSKASTLKTLLDEWDGYPHSFSLLKEGSLKNIPITLIFRDSSWIINQRKEWLKDIPQAKWVVAERSGHMVQIDRPDVIIDECAEMIRNFVASNISFV